MNKTALRQQIRQQKRAMTEQEILEKSRCLTRQFLDTEHYRRAGSIYGYLPCNQEVRTQAILEQALADGKAVALPKCFGGQMRFIWVTDLKAVCPGSMGAPEPAADGPLAEDPDALILMPGLAFDAAGNRLGYGGGYYDRFLAREPGHPTVALCYDFQVLPRLETEEFDIPVDLILRA